MEVLILGVVLQYIVSASLKLFPIGLYTGCTSLGLFFNLWLVSVKIFDCTFYSENLNHKHSSYDLSQISQQFLLTGWFVQVWSTVAQSCIGKSL